MLTLRDGHRNEDDPGWPLLWVAVVGVVIALLAGLYAQARDRAEAEACAGGAIVTDAVTTVVMAESEC